MQPVGKKSGGFKCPTFSVPAKPKVNQSLSSSKPSEQVEPNPVKPGPCGDTDSDSKTSVTEVLKPTELGDNGSAAENISSETDSKKEFEVSWEPDKPEKKSTEESVVPKKIAKKKAKFCLKPSVTDSSSSTQVDNEDKKTESKNKKSKSEKSLKAEKNKTKKLEKSEKVRKTADNKKDKPIKDDKNSSKAKEKQSVPGRSLSDAEYDALFNAVLETAQNLNMEEWQPKTTSPVKVKEPMKKKYSITVGKKVKHAGKPDKLDNSTVEDALEDPDESAKKDKIDKTDPCCEDEEVHKVNAGLDDETDDVEMDAVDNKADDVAEKTGDVDSKEDDVDDDDDDECVAAEDKLDENNNADAVVAAADDPPVADDDENMVVNEENANVEEMESNSVQGENEVTPPVSVSDITEKLPVNVATPIKKKKKILKAKKKLEPKHLPFNESKETSMVEKIRQMKQIKKCKGEETVKKDRPRDCRNDKIHPKPVKSSEKKISKKRKMQQRELDAKGTWVLCCNSDCMKWRYLDDVCDPSLVPDRWTCFMNTNTECNSCDKPEENYDESEHIYTKFTEGSIVWAKMTGYPWWPAMVEIDPDTETFFSVDSEDSMFPTHYHVVFFDDHVSRVWVKSELVVQFTGDEADDGIVMQSSKKRGPSYKNDIAKAKKNAINAQKCTLKERIELFGFAAKYKGPWASDNKKAKTKKLKIALKQGKSEETFEDTEYLDDNTVDDVLENTESLLDNVEEMLNSLDSQLDNTDEDSDFAPDELVVVEKKSKTSTGRRIVENKSSETNMSNSDKSEKKVTLATTVASNDSCYKIKSKGDSSNIDEEPDNNDATDVKATSKTSDKPEGKKRKKIDEKNKSNKNEKESKPLKKKKKVNEEAVETKVESKKIKMNKEDDKKLKNLDEEVKEEEANKNISCSPEISKMVVDTEEVKTTDNVKVDTESEDGKADEFDLLADEKGETDDSKEENNEVEEEFDLLADEDTVKSVSNDKSSVEKNGDDKHDDDNDDFDLVGNEDKTTLEAENNDDDNFDLIDDVADTKSKVENDNNDDDDFEPVGNEADKKLETENNDYSKLDNDDEFDLMDDETDAKSKAENNKNDDEDDFDLIDEVISKPEAVVPQRNIEQSLDDGDEDDFDLEEHFMYDTNADTTDKIRELSNVNGNTTTATAEIATAEIEEYSDPFDLMEE